MEGGERISPFGDTGKRREGGRERAAAGKQSREGLGGRPRREESSVVEDEMPRIEARVGSDRGEQLRPLLALDRNRTQALRAVPGEDLVERPSAEAAVLVVQQNTLLRLAQRVTSRGAATGASARRVESTT